MARTPHFFRIILADSVQKGRLVIPKSFVRRYGNHLSRIAILKVPNGAKWQVDLVKNGDDVWFGNGWRNFADHYSVSLGTFLVVGFEDFRSCSFNVFIFDNNTSEINYPLHDHVHLEEPADDSPPMNEENSTSDDVDVYAHSEAEQRVNQSFTRNKAPNKAEKGKAVYIHSEEIDDPFHLQEEDNDENSEVDVWPISSEDESPIPSFSRPEAEYVALAEAAKEAIWIRKFVSELGVVPDTVHPITNTGAVAQAKEPRSHHSTKHIDRRYNLIRDYVAKGEVRIERVPTDDNIADPLTKPMTQRVHDRHTSSWGINFKFNWL